MTTLRQELDRLHDLYESRISELKEELAEAKGQLVRTNKIREQVLRDQPALLWHSGNEPYMILEKDLDELLMLRPILYLGVSFAPTNHRDCVWTQYLK